MAASRRAGSDSSGSRIVRTVLASLVPRNWLDGSGLIVIVVGLVGFIATAAAISEEVVSGSDLSLAYRWLNFACFSAVFCGYFIRRFARKESPFGTDADRPR